MNSAFCSIWVLKRLDGAHPHWGVCSTEFTDSNSHLMGNILTETLRIVFNLEALWFFTLADKLSVTMSVTVGCHGVVSGPSRPSFDLILGFLAVCAWIGHSTSWILVLFTPLLPSCRVLRDKVLLPLSKPPI